MKHFHKLIHDDGSEIYVHNAIFLSALRIFTSVTPEVAAVYQSYFNKTQKFICVSHFLYTAQNLLARTVMSGGKVSKTAENVAYLNDGDIPDHLIDIINNEIQSFAGNTAVCRSDVSRYINYYMKKYADTIDWDVFQEVSYEESKEDPVQFTGFEELESASEAPIPLAHTYQGPLKVKLKVLGCSSKPVDDSYPLVNSRVDEESEHSEATETQLY
ncbi:unnamed protein product [Cylicocyclus nassatus]|uniref:Uncharacterized protein n=1 Tax=Cylicocyclus nassatus TaxID=53992 RepID=A0AA36M3I8_CYLNA|nr:unnamed protein product [Cylicocyclus nassatus]